MSFQVIPNEVVDRIIDFLHDGGTETLFSCSLVARSWLPTAHFHNRKFRRVHVSTISPLFKLVTSPESQLYLRGVLDIGFASSMYCQDVASNEVALGVIASHPEHFCHVSDLSISNLDFGTVTPGVLESSFAAFSQVSSLTMYNCQFSSPEQFYTILKKMRSLSMMDVCLVGALGGRCDQALPPQLPCLKTLHMYSLPSEEHHGISNLMSNIDSIVDLQTLRVRFYDLVGMDGVLKRARTSLRELYISDINGDIKWAPVELHNLEVIFLQRQIADGAPVDCVVLLKVLLEMVMLNGANWGVRRIALQATFSFADWERDPMLFTALDAALCQLPKLSVIETMVDFDSKETLKMFPRCVARGIKLELGPVFADSRSLL
ncbi:hypothetical protein C8J56DRAFT_353534 [Mycena floridula]|nr:hypothetical protein C8J56DRAFT_353534 [Mycena floridula]